MTASTRAFAAHPAQVAGMFYPADPAALSAALDAAFAAAPPCPFRAKMVVVPHAGIDYSGLIAAKALRALDTPKRLKRVVILGPNHRLPLDGIALHPAHAWATPLGVAPVAEDAARAILSLDGVKVDARPFAGEHSLEMPLIFVQRMFPDVEIVPVLVGTAEPALVEEAVERLWGGPETAICLSSDLSHFLSKPAARERDDATRVKIERGVWSELQSGDACGYAALRGAIRVAEARGMRTTGIAFATSDEAGGPSERVVGYGAFAFEEADAARLADSDRARLFAIAAASLEFAAAHDGETPEIALGAGVSPALSAQRASFVTLERDGRLRGCIGSPAPRMSLSRDVATNAVAAGFGDPRFSPLKRERARRTDDLDLRAVAGDAVRLGRRGRIDRQASPPPRRADPARARRRRLVPAERLERAARPARIRASAETQDGSAADHWSGSMRAWRFTTESFEAPFAAAKAGGFDGIAPRESVSPCRRGRWPRPSDDAASRRTRSTPASTRSRRTPLPSPRQPEARPAFEVDALAQEEALRAPGGEHAGDVGVEQAGDDRVAVARGHARPARARAGAAAWRGCWRTRRRRARLRARARFSTPRDSSGRQCAATPLRRALALATSTATGSRSPSQTLRLQDFRRGDGEHAGAAADVEDVARPPTLQQAIEMQQAAARRAVMAGAEGEAGLDLDADVVGLERARGRARRGRGSARP